MKTAYANRGMGLETLIEHANAQYAAKGIAAIQKVATPWKVIRKGSQIVNAFPEKKSTVDFIGVYEGKAIAFDAKETENKTRFPLSNIEDHQLRFMRSWQKSGGIAFFIIEFKNYGETYLLFFDELVEIQRHMERESIPYKYFKIMGKRVGQGEGIVLDYLKAIEISA